jgi:4-amino-4-deoxychorismate lyase
MDLLLASNKEDSVRISSSAEFRVTTSMRWCFSTSGAIGSPERALLGFHQRRLLASAKAFHFDQVEARFSGHEGQTLLLAAIEEHRRHVEDPSNMHKVTLSVSSSGSIAVNAVTLSGPLYDFQLPSPEHTASDSPIKATVYLSQQATPATLFTLHKTSHRYVYNAARTAAKIDHDAPTAAEVLLYNQHDQVTETSVSTIYFLRKGLWLTPASSCGGNLGSTRSLALSSGRCREGLIMKQSIIDGEAVFLSNGVRGFWPAKIVLSRGS